MNNGGARTDLNPEADGTVRFGQIFAMQPFANNLVTKSYTGAEVKAVLEQQFVGRRQGSIAAQSDGAVGQFRIRLRSVAAARGSGWWR